MNAVMENLLKSLF